MNSWGCVTKTTWAAIATGTPAISSSCPDISRSTMETSSRSRSGTPLESRDRQLSISCTVGSWGSSAGLIIKARHLVGFNLCSELGGSRVFRGSPLDLLLLRFLWLKLLRFEMRARDKSNLLDLILVGSTRDNLHIASCLSASASLAAIFLFGLRFFNF